MKRIVVLAFLAVVVFVVGFPLAADAPEKKTPRQALRAFNDLIGSWRGTGEPNGTREEKQRQFWQEKISWEWRFKGKDIHLRAAFDKGKYFTTAELRYLPEKQRYQLIAMTQAKEKLVFEGTLDRKRLTLERIDEKKKEAQRLVVKLLHFNRYVYSYEVKPAERTAFREVYHVGATKEGVAFAGDDDKPECVVSGGLGTMPVMYKGKTYYVCCSGCRDAFLDEPEKYIKEFEARKKAKSKAR
ncbi:MAG TPA: YHS domain-containing protein [Gemmataceae bacterium]|nr:YHS domain-containing protein [Gemmataceae bacterium]